MRGILWIAAVGVVALLAGCADDGAAGDADEPGAQRVADLPDRSEVPDGPLPAKVERELDGLLADLTFFL